LPKAERAQSSIQDEREQCAPALVGAIKIRANRRIPKQLTPVAATGSHVAHYWAARLFLYALLKQSQTAGLWRNSVVPYHNLKNAY
jgi:hypothetical protein